MTAELAAAAMARLIASAVQQSADREAGHHQSNAQDDDADDDVYEVEKILDHRFYQPEEEKEGGGGGGGGGGDNDATTAATNQDTVVVPRVELLVQWAGYPDPKDYTWELEAELQPTALDAVVTYWEQDCPAGSRSDALALGQYGGQFEALRVMAGPKFVRQRGPASTLPSTPTTTTAEEGEGENGWVGENTAGKTNTTVKGSGRGRPPKGTPKRKKLKKNHGGGGGDGDGDGGVLLKLYRVEWVGYKEKTWEPAESLPQDMIAQYESRRYVDKQQRGRKRKR